MRYSKILAAVAAAAILVPGAVLAKTVKVGIVLPYTGGGADFAKQIEKGMKLYLSQNKGKLGGHEVKLVTRDSKRPGGDIAKVAVQELITREKVDILGGFVYSPNAMSVAPLVTEAKVPMVIMNAGTSFIPAMSPYYARVSFTMWQSGYHMGKYAAEKLGHKTAMAGFTNYPPGKDSAAAFKRGFEDAGGKVTELIPMGGPREVPDFTPFFQKVKDAKPNALYMFVPAGSHASAVVKTYNDLGMPGAGISLIGPGDITQDTKLQGMGDGAQGLVTVHHYSADYDTPENKAFVKAWKGAYGADTTPDFMGVAGYDGMAAIVDLIAKLDGNIDADKAMGILKGWKFASPRGPIMIDPATRDIVQNVYVHKVTKKGDRLMIEVVATIPQVKDPCKELKVGKCK